MSPSRAEEARIQAGLSLAEAARRLNVTPRYLRALERGQRGGFPYMTAMRGAKLYGCPLFWFLSQKKGGEPEAPATNASPSPGRVRRQARNRPRSA